MRSKPRIARASSGAVALRAQLGGDELGERRRVLEAEHRHEVLLRVELQPLGLELALEVDREVRDAQQRAREVDEHGCAARSASRSTTRPASERSRSSQVWSSTPPYGSTASWR